MRPLAQRDSAIAVVRAHMWPVAYALGLVAAITVVIYGLIAVFNLKHGAIIYLIPVTFAATRWGLVPALVAAGAGTLAAEYFFYEPTFSFVISDPQEIVDLILYIVVAVVTSPLAASQKRQAEIAHQREIDMRGLYAFSRRLASAHTASDIYSAIQDHLSQLVSRKVVLLGIGHAAEGNFDWLSDGQLPIRVRDNASAIAAGRTDSVTELTVDAGDGDIWLVRAVSAQIRELGVIAIELGHPLDPVQRLGLARRTERRHPGGHPLPHRRQPGVGNAQPHLPQPPSPPPFPHRLHPLRGRQHGLSPDSSYPKIGTRYGG